MSLWAKPGVKCVCVRKTPWILIDKQEVTAFGPRYDERVTVAVTVTNESFGLNLYLVEYPLDSGGNPPIFPVKFFRPLVDLADDLALFSEILDRVGEPA